MPTKTGTKTGQTPKKDAPKKQKESGKSSDGLVAATAELKQDKKSLNLKSADATPTQEIPVADIEELEEQEEEATAAASTGGGNAAALAAANGSTEMSASFKNFRHHPDMENFYRFIYENDLRHEALAIIDEIMAEKLKRKLVKNAKVQPH